MKNKTTKAAGFTLVELLVVIAIIGILIGMLLPAVQTVREAARRSSCSNKLRQLALAVHNYESSRQRFPVNQIGAGDDDGSGNFQAGHYSWLVPALPFLEQQNVSDQFDLSFNNGDNDSYKVSDTHANAMAVSQVIDTFLCPSDSPNFENAVILGSANPAPSSYAGNAGWPPLSTGFSGERATPGDFNGVIPLVNPGSPVAWHGDGRVGFSHVTDGSSNTALVVERLIQSGNSGDAIKTGDVRLRSVHVQEEPESQAEIVLQMTEFFDPHPHIFQAAHVGRSWSSGWSFIGSTYMHVQAPNLTNGHYNSSVDEGDLLVTASSRHPGGVNMALLDGSVRFVADDVSQEVWWALGSREDGRFEGLDN